MSDLRQAAQDALIAMELQIPNCESMHHPLKYRHGADNCHVEQLFRDARDNLRAALAAPKRKRIPMDDVWRLFDAARSKSYFSHSNSEVEFARAIETELARRWGVEIEDEQD